MRPSQNQTTNQSNKLAEETGQGWGGGGESEEQNLHMPAGFLPWFVLFCFFLSLTPKTGSLYVILAGLELLV